MGSEMCIRDRPGTAVRPFENSCPPTDLEPVTNSEKVWKSLEKFGDNDKVRLGKKRSKTNGVELGKVASGLWVYPGAIISAPVLSALPPILLKAMAIRTGLLIACPESY